MASILFLNISLLSLMACKENTTLFSDINKSENNKRTKNANIMTTFDFSNKKSNNKSSKLNHNKLPPLCNFICKNPVQLSLTFENIQGGFLSFDNFSTRFRGHCRGHAVISQRFNHLAKFEPEKSSPCSMPENSVEYESSEACYDYLKEKIVEMSDSKVVTFEGFKNLKDLSSHPDAKLLLRTEIIKIPHKYSTLPEKIDGEHDLRKINVFYEIIKRLQNAQLPYIAVKGPEVGNHGLIAYAVTELEGKEVICIRDSNFVPESPSEACQNFVYLENERVWYVREKKGVSELWKFDLFRDETERQHKFMMASRNYCIDQKYQEGKCRISGGINPSPMLEINSNSEVKTEIERPVENDVDANKEQEVFEEDIKFNKI